MGNIANTAAMLGITLGMKMPEVVAPEVVDGTGNIHMGITAAKISGVPAEDLSYFGIAIYGPKKKINKLTGSLPLLR